MTVDAAIGLQAIAHTKAYLQAFDEELAKVTTSQDLVAAMVARYPDLGLDVALNIGAKVATGEMKWG